MKIVFHGIIKQGKVKLDLSEKWLVYLSGLEGLRIELTLQKERHARTLSQNSYYWGVIIEILGNHFGYEPDEMHEELKRKFNPKISKIDSNLTFGGSTARLSTVEFINYIDRIVRYFAQEYGICIPDPGEYI